MGPKRGCNSQVLGFWFAVSEAEFLRLAEEVRPYTRQAMKIEPAPWIQDYMVHMDEMYCELTLQKQQNRPYGREGVPVKDYREIFK